MKYSWPRFELDPGSYELLHDGEVIELQPRVADVLTYLLVNRDRVVTKEELLDNIWATASSASRH